MNAPTFRDIARKSLLPAGLSDSLPPDAHHESCLREALMDAFGARGYDRVKPPLVEFEENLLTGAGKELDTQTFRLMDPHSQRMMAVRSDMTPQVGRIACTRLRNAPRPLRLSYAGEVLRVKGGRLRPERQFAQAGAELIGVSSVAADAEIVLLVCEALSELGVADVSVDLSSPRLADRVLDARGIERNQERTALINAVIRRETAYLKAIGENPAAHDLTPCDGLAEAAVLLGRLTEASGELSRAQRKLAAISLPGAAAAHLEHLLAVAQRLHDAALPAHISVDPVERKGFRYQTGICFTLFARDVRGELGRGGRYEVAGEPATGVSLYMDTQLRAVTPPRRRERVFLPLGVSAAVARDLRARGLVTVAGLDGRATTASGRDVLIGEARRQNCHHVRIGEETVAVRD